MDTKVRTSMTSQPVSIASDVSISDAREVMRSWGMRHLPVVDGTELVGVISDRDILRAFALHKAPATQVADVMTRSPYRVKHDVGVAVVAKTMALNKFGCAIVTDSEERVVGIFTTTDALQLLAKILHEPQERDYRVLRLSEYLSWQRAVS
jgi:acetoin utilization protein AcuB